MELGVGGEPLHVLFVCSNNTVRSPMAAVLFEREALKTGMPVVVRSAGLNAVPDRMAEPLAQQALQAFACDISSHRTRRLTVADLAWANVVFSMNRADRVEIRSMCEASPAVELFGEMDDRTHGDVDAPRRADIEAFRALATQMANLSRLAVSWLSAETV